MGYLLSGNKVECTGCKLCEQVCPQKCIKFLEDNEGFAYPVKGKDCIDCGLCDKLCPQNKKIVKLERQEVYVAKLIDNNEVYNSSSGGMFWAVVQTFCDKNFVVFGAKYDDDLNVVHDFETNIKDANKFRKSKYVQSDMNGVYIKSKEFLEDGKKVLFTGTPCQVAGLKSYLNKDYEKLLTIDIICHGVPSQKVFNKYLNYVENKYKSNIKKINFREKVLKNNKWNSRNIKVELENGQVIVQDNNENIYLKGFHKALFYRRSCEKCKYANPNRVSDITIADCWGIENILPNRDPNKGESMVILNSKRGKKIFETIKRDLDFEKLDLEFAIKNNKQFVHPAIFNKKREYFFKNIDKEPIDRLILKSTKKSNLLIRIFRKIKKL